MSIYLINNDVYSNAAELRSTDTSDVDAGDADEQANVTSGPRHIRFTQDGTADRRLAYINKTNTLSATWLVLTNADKHATHELKFHEWSTYTSTKRVLFDVDSHPSSTLVGKSSNDLVGRMGRPIADFTRAKSERLFTTDNTYLSPGDTDFSICGWVMADTITSTMGVISQWKSSGNRLEYILYQNATTGKLSFAVSDNGTSTSATATVADNLAADQMYFFYCYHDNGTEIGISYNNGTAVTTAHTTGVHETDGSCQVGSYDSGNTYDGGIGPLRFYNRLLTADEISTEYNNGIALLYRDLPESLREDCLAAWDLTETSGDRADSGPNNLDLTDTNTVSVDTLCDAEQALGIDFLAGTGGSYAAEVGKFYLGSGLEFTEIVGEPTFRSRWETVILHNQAWQIEEECSITFGPITRAPVETIQQSPDIGKDAVFFYDPLGVIFADKLYHALILAFSFRPTGNVDDSFLVDFQLARLRDN